MRSVLGTTSDYHLSYCYGLAGAAWIAAAGRRPSGGPSCGSAGITFDVTISFQQMSRSS